MMRHYIFDLECPRCGKTDMLVVGTGEQSPHLKCTDCLMNDAEIVELTIVRCTVIDGAREPREA